MFRFDTCRTPWLVKRNKCIVCVWACVSVCMRVCGHGGVLTGQSPSAWEACFGDSQLFSGVVLVKAKWLFPGSEEGLCTVCRLWIRCVGVRLSEVRVGPPLSQQTLSLSPSLPHTVAGPACLSVSNTSSPPSELNGPLSTGQTFVRFALRKTLKQLLD